jgi:hypothetical protein
MNNPTSLIDRAIWRWPNLDRADRLPEHTWINHALITFLVGGTIGTIAGWIVALVAGLFGLHFDGSIGLRIGVVVFAAGYQIREIRQWSRVPPHRRPKRWWWDASLDILSPWLVVALVFGERTTATIIAIAIANLHWFFRPESEVAAALRDVAVGIEMGTIADPATMLRDLADEV